VVFRYDVLVLILVLVVVVIIVVGSAVVVIVVVVVGSAVVVDASVDPVTDLGFYLTVLEFGLELDAAITVAEICFNLDAILLFDLDAPT
jgi:hypothetical protein